AYEHEENSFVDFKLQPLLPHGHSRQGPGLAVSDVNSDGLADVYVSGATGHAGALFLQQPTGKFQRQLAAGIDSLGESLGVLFVGGRVTPGAYPTTPRSYLLQNESKNGKCTFRDVTQQVSPSLAQAGMVTSALWSDYDNDGWVDLLLAGEFMPLRFYHNQHGN